MEINGLPAHVLIIHAAVIFLPFAATAALVYAFLPRWRWASRWPMVIVSAMALGSVVAAWFSGRNLRDHMKDAGALQGEVASQVSSHAEKADVLLWLTIVFFVVVLLSAWLLGGDSALISARGGKARHNNLVEWSVMAMVAMMAVSVLAMGVATGDAGAQAVWEA